MRTLMEMTHDSRGNQTDTQSDRDTSGGAKAQSIVAVFLHFPRFNFSFCLWKLQFLPNICSTFSREIVRKVTMSM